MQDFWKKHHYEVFITEDKSPTLRWLAHENQETMHHRGGAYTETQQIYGDPLREVIAKGARSAVSVGLGLGYNEILVACEALKSQISPADFHLLSFESEEVLRSQFLLWLSDKAETSIYEELWQFFQKTPGCPPKNAIQNWLKEACRQKSWDLQGSLTPDFKAKQRYEFVFYDAFSSKTSPHLWSEDFLLRFFDQACAEKSVFATYACTGVLKRSLKAAGFAVIVEPGFHSRKDRTRGVRGF